MSNTKPIKALGQNFLTNHTIAETMINALELTATDTIVEIGPGPGALTKILVPRLALNNKLIAVELDKRFSTLLTEEYKQNKNVTILNENILDWLPDTNLAPTFKVLGSLPYYITSPILHMLTKLKIKPLTAVLLVQYEVGQKLVAKENELNYLATFIKTFFFIEFIAKVDREDFSPSPVVDSAVIKLTAKASPITADELNAYEKFLHRGFSNPRKMLNKVFTQEELDTVKIASTLRPQNINVETWVKLFKNLYSNG